MGTVRAVFALSSVVVVSTFSQECGVKESTSRIVGGRDSGGYHYPWFALLVLKQNEDFPVCAGSLITPYYVLTAAHCFTIKPSTPKESLFTVLMGVYDRCNRKERTRERFGVSRVVAHEGYDGKFRDIAVMRLDRAADFTIVCLPSPGMDDTTVSALLIGFGATRYGARRQPCRMMEAAITKYSKSDCERTYLPKEDVAEATVICAGNLRGGVDSCQGDSGGPLLTATSDGRYVISGIVSYGYGCGNPRLPGLYTNVAAYVTWIRSKISSEGSNVSTKPVRFPADAPPRRDRTNWENQSKLEIVFTGRNERDGRDDRGDSATTVDGEHFNPAKTSSVVFPDD